MKKYNSLFWTGAFFPLFILAAVAIVLVGRSQEEKQPVNEAKEIQVDTVYVVKIVTDTVYIHTQQFCKKKHCEETQEIQDTIN